MKFKRSTGSAAPESLDPGQPAFVEGTGAFFVGSPTDGTPLQVGQMMQVITESDYADLDPGPDARTIYFVIADP
jgi:hypothetical protein